VIGDRSDLADPSIAVYSAAASESSTGSSTAANTNWAPSARAVALVRHGLAEELGQPTQRRVRRDLEFHFGVTVAEQRVLPFDGVDRVRSSSAEFRETSTAASRRTRPRCSPVDREDTVAKPVVDQRDRVRDWKFRERLTPPLAIVNRRGDVFDVDRAPRSSRPTSRFGGRFVHRRYRNRVEIPRSNPAWYRGSRLFPLGSGSPNQASEHDSSSARHSGTPRSISLRESAIKRSCSTS